jgi:5-carboxyvanillate decarboxylase
MKQASRRIATEEAFVTREIMTEWRRALTGADIEPGFRAMGDSILGERPETSMVHQRLLDLGAGRIAHMDATGIDVQLLSLTSPGVQVFDAPTGTALAADSNDQLAAAIAAHPQRLAGLVAVAPQNPAAAAKEIDRGVNRLGLRGVIINSHTHGEYLDQPPYGAILEACEALNAPLYLHPRDPSPQMIAPYLDYGLYFAGWGFAAETGLHAMRLIMSGAFERHPRLKIVLGHMGEGIPYYLQRIDNRYLLQVKIGVVKKLQRLPSEYFRDNFVVTTSGCADDAALQLCLTVLGSKRLMFAADFPYENVEEAVRFMDAAPLSDADRAALYYRNAETLFGLAPAGGSTAARAGGKA